MLPATLFCSLAAVILWADPRRGCAADAPASADEAGEQLYNVYLSGDYFAPEKQLGSLASHDPRREFFESQLDAAFLHGEPAQANLRWHEQRNARRSSCFVAHAR